MGYHAKYLNEYKKIMNPKTNWINHLIPIDKFLFMTMPLWIICPILIFYIIPLLIANYLMDESYMIGILTVLLMLMMPKLLNKTLEIIDYRVDKQKTGVAQEIYSVDKWSTVIELKRYEFVKLLKKDCIKSAKQIEVIIVSIEEAIKRKVPKDIVNMGIKGAFVLTAWNELVKNLYNIINQYNKLNTLENMTLENMKLQTINVMIENIGLCVLLIIASLIILYCIDIVRKAYLDIKNNDIHKLKEMKNILLDIHLKLINNPEYLK